MKVEFNDDWRAYDNVKALIRAAKIERAKAPSNREFLRQIREGNSDQLDREAVDPYFASFDEDGLPTEDGMPVWLPEVGVDDLPESAFDCLPTEVEVLDQLGLGADDPMTEQQFREARRIVRAALNEADRFD